MSRLERNFLFLVLALVALLAVVGAYAFRQVTDSVVQGWGQRMAENQVRYNSSRLLQPLEREIALTQQMARSPTLISWAENPTNPLLNQLAIRELESFRENFLDNSYFIALTKTNDYYYNNSSNEFLGDELRYRLRKDRPADAWFFGLIDQGRDLHINVNPDVELGITKLWIDVLMRDDDGNILAVLGTGIPLEELINQSVVARQSGVTGMFVDSQGAIQLYQDQRLIDFASFVQPEGQKRTVDLVVDFPDEGRLLLDKMKEMQQRPEFSQDIVTQYVTISGERHLVALAYLPKIGWFDVTFLNLSEILPYGEFWPLGLIFVMCVIFILFIIHYALRREILFPLGVLADQMERFGASKGSASALTEQIYQGELRQIFFQFQKMADLVQSDKERLEVLVEERTRELEKKAREDGLTGLLNRAAMTEVISRESQKCSRLEKSYGVIWIDIDKFKKINDKFGHATGDTLILELAQELRRDLRLYDYASRWGGDEFLVLLSPCDEDHLELVSNRLREAIKRNPMFLDYNITVSTGSALSDGQRDFSELLAVADAALYRAKAKQGDASA